MGARHHRALPASPNRFVRRLHHSHLAPSFILATLLACRTTHPIVPGDGCRPKREEASALYDFALAHATAPAGSRAAILRDSLGLAAVPASEVRWVTDPATCQRAARALGSALREGDGIPRQVWVVAAGDRYLVYDPTVTSGHHDMGAVFDRQWRFRAFFFG